MLEALPDDGQRHEIIDGVHYVTPSPGVPHQFVISVLFGELLTYLRAHPVGWVFTGPSDIELAEDTIVQPDVVVVRRSGARPPKTWRDAGLPILAVEVLSPSSASRDRIVKRVRYQRAGIPEYWIVDPVSRVLERWRADSPHPEVFTETMMWLPEGAVTPLVFDLHPIFDPVSEEG
jgi:Uma2 family endonuclease